MFTGECCNLELSTPFRVSSRRSRRNSTNSITRSPFKSTTPKAFVLANALTAAAPGDLDHVFVTNSGSEAVDTALKIVLAYHQARGDGGRFRLIGRRKEI